MKIFKEIFGRVWALWGLVFFTLTMLVFMIPYLLLKTLPEPVRTHKFIRISKIWMTIFLHGVGCPLKVKGYEQFLPGRNYIVVCNHNSMMDVPVSCPFVPGGNKTIAKKEFARTPLFGILYKMGSVLVDRKSEVSRRESYEQMKEVLEMGLHMCIYPEGTRNKTPDPLKSFHSGAFRLAVDTGKEIIPSLLFHTKKAMPTEKPFFLWPHRLEMHFLSPVQVNPSDTVESLQDRVFQTMLSYYIAHR